MNEQQWENLKVLIDEEYSFCLSYLDYISILSMKMSGPENSGFEMCTERDLIKLGLVGWFRSGLVAIYVSKNIEEGYIRISSEKSNSNIIQNIVQGKSVWSSAVPLDYLTSVEQLERLLKLKAFW
jgi:hypothetical protein